MAEFGEQLKKAREAKGITQQSLADKVYVTRQTISRWESGSRYPDLLVLKKLAQILDVTTDDLLSDGEIKYIPERNPVVESNAVNYLTIAMFSGIVITYLINMVEILIRLPMLAQSFTKADAGIIWGNLFFYLLGFFAFTIGLVWIFRKSFSPKKVGAVIMTFYFSSCIREMSVLMSEVHPENMSLVLVMIVVSAIGLISGYAFFWRKQNTGIWSVAIAIVSILGIIRSIWSLETTIVYASEYISAETAINVVLNICIYILFIYQMHILKKKRNMVINVVYESGK